MQEARMPNWDLFVIAGAFLISGCNQLQAKERKSVHHGIASVYSHAQTTRGGKGNDNTLTAAHRTLPFGTRVKVTNLRNGRSVVVRINDRGPFVKGRIVDLNKAPAKILGISGLARVGLVVQVRHEY
jgi:rare lipoprotein A